MSEFKLSASLSGHEDDVRGVTFPNPKAVISVSRDGNTIVWDISNENPNIHDNKIVSHSSEFSNAVAYLPPSAEFPEGLVISGGKDVVIDVRQPSKAQNDNAEALLLGHSSNICTLDVDPAGKFILSGSWDSDARLWPVGKWECETTFKGHEHTVWAVLAYDSDTIITASADQKIRIFHRNGKLIRAFKASDSPVRALCRVPNNPDADFASADNAGVISLWKISGQKVADLFGHDSFIYSLASLPSGELVSSGEDRTVKIWRGTTCIQTITHPAISVWSVAVCAETGDIVSGASDNIVRVFTRREARIADAETTRLFDEAVSSSAIPQQSLSQNLNTEKLPGPEFLTQKAGTKEGQVQMIKELNGSVTAHTWSTGAGQWVNVGTVVDAVGSSGKKIDYLGKEYDYVFDVDMEDGKPPLKLPYNLSQNPYEAASKFITENEAPISYLDQVANFIIQNTQGATLGQAPETSGGDPWGTGDRYRPGDGDAVPTALPPPPKKIPQNEYLSILTVRVAGVQKKLGELNKELIDNGHKDLSMNPTELGTLDKLCKTIDPTGEKKMTDIYPTGLDLAVKLCTIWPYKNRLPALDLMRILAVSPQAAAFSHPRGGNLIDVIIAGATEEEPPAPNHLMMALRAFANLFLSEPGRTLALSEVTKITSLIATAISPSKVDRNLLVAATTVHINYAVLFTSSEASQNFEHILGMVDSLTKILVKEVDSEAVYRAMVALGTLLTIDKEVTTMAKDVYGVEGALTKAVGKASDPRIKHLAIEIRALVK